MVTIDDILDGRLDDATHDPQYIDFESMALKEGFAPLLAGWEVAWRVYSRARDENAQFSPAYEFIAFKDTGGGLREMLWGEMNSPYLLVSDLQTIDEVSSLGWMGKTLLRLGIGKNDYALSRDAVSIRKDYALAAISLFITGPSRKEERLKRLRENAMPFAEELASDLKLFREGTLDEQQLWMRYGPDILERIERYSPPKEPSA